MITDSSTAEILQQIDSIVEQPNVVGEDTVTDNQLATDKYFVWIMDH